jgi:hypothetical protein
MYALQISTDDPMTCLVVEPDGRGGADIVGSFRLESEESMAKRFGIDTPDPALHKPTWRWRVEADEGNGGGGHFA